MRKPSKHTKIKQPPSQAHQCTDNTLSSDKNVPCTDHDSRYIDSLDMVLNFKAYLSNIAEEWDPVNRVAPVGRLIQAKGTGKTRLITHIGRSIYTVYMAGTAVKGGLSPQTTYTPQPQPIQRETDVHGLQYNDFGHVGIGSLIAAHIACPNISIDAWARRVVIASIRKLCDDMEFNQRLAPSEWIEMQTQSHTSPTRRSIRGDGFWDQIHALCNQGKRKKCESDICVIEPFDPLTQVLDDLRRVLSQNRLQRGYACDALDIGIVFAFDHFDDCIPVGYISALVKALGCMPTSRHDACSVVGVLIGCDADAMEMVMTDVVKQRVCDSSVNFSNSVSNGALGGTHPLVEDDLKIYRPFWRIRAWNLFLKDSTPRVTDIMQFYKPLGWSVHDRSIQSVSQKSGLMSSLNDLDSIIVGKRKEDQHKNDLPLVTFKSIWPYLYEMGRPIWRTYSSSPVTGAPIQAAMRLICKGAAINKNVPELTDDHDALQTHNGPTPLSFMIALLSVRLSVVFTSKFSLSRALLKSHLAMCFNVDSIQENRREIEVMEVGYPSEPVLAESASCMLRMNMADTGLPRWCNAISALSQLADVNQIKPANDPTLVARILLLLAMDNCTQSLTNTFTAVSDARKTNSDDPSVDISSSHHSQLEPSRVSRTTTTTTTTNTTTKPQSSMPNQIVQATLPVRLSELLKKLLPPKKAKQAFKALPQTLLDATLFFNHFTRLSTEINEHTIQAHLNFCTAIHVSAYCLVIPLLIVEVSGARRVSALMVRVDKPYEPPMTDDAEMTLFSDAGYCMPVAGSNNAGACDSLPYLVLNLCLCGDPTVTIRSSSDIDPMRSVIRITGVSGASYACLRPQADPTTKIPVSALYAYENMCKQLIKLCDISRALAYATDSARVMDDMYTE